MMGREGTILFRLIMSYQVSSIWSHCYNSDSWPWNVLTALYTINHYLNHDQMYGHHRMVFSILKDTDRRNNYGATERGHPVSIHNAISCVTCMMQSWSELTLQLQFYPERCDNDSIMYSHISCIMTQNIITSKYNVICKKSRHVYVNQIRSISGVWVKFSRILLTRLCSKSAVQSWLLHPLQQRHREDRRSVCGP